MDIVTCGETGKRLELRCGTIARFSPPQYPKVMNDSETATLEAAQVVELLQKLALAEQAVNEKDLELNEMATKLEQVEEEAKELNR